MSYCRRGYDFLGPEYASDVYVYDTDDGWVCDDCPRLGHHSEPTAKAMAEHLVADVAAGFRVPPGVIDGLEDELGRQQQRQAELDATDATPPPTDEEMAEWKARGGTLAWLKARYPLA